MRFTRCNLLHWGYENHPVPDVPAHRHDYFQIELCVKGFIDLTTQTGKLHIAPKEWVLIPPETEHAMRYAAEGLEYYSFKFSVSDLAFLPPAEVLFSGQDNLSCWIIDSLKTQRPANCYKCMPINENRSVLEALLLSMLQRALLPVNTPQLPETLQKLQSLIASEGARVNIKNAGEMLNMAPNQFKYRARTALNELAENITLKDFIDRELLHHTDRMLFYSDLSINKIAERLNFNNIYTFSRFVRRLTGESPLQRRKNHPSTLQSSCQQPEK